MKLHLQYRLIIPASFRQHNWKTFVSGSFISQKSKVASNSILDKSKSFDLIKSDTVHNFTAMLDRCPTSDQQKFDLAIY